ncbi:phosphatase PAP2 family protein [Streptomyces monticola]|uniref:Phosphatase PAP2 family protein n=1 Tax=Streptomyces monticola TaxID=2666263 RepID=A0ABW2JSU8_9ACTN
MRRADEGLGLLVGRSQFPDRAAELLADLGGITVAPLVLVAVLAYVARRGGASGEPCWWAAPFAALLALASVPVLVSALKALFDRQGPPGMGTHGGFYPSGHSTTATVAYGAAALLLVPLVRSAYLRRELLIGAGLLVAAVGLGLVRRGYHWPLDVVGGWLLGGMILIVMTLGARHLVRPAGDPAEE